jgi:two-component system response regulator FixJ
VPARAQEPPLAPPTVYIVDDDPAVRDSLRVLLEVHGKAVRDFASARAFLDDCPAPRPGSLLLIDLDMPGTDGLDLVAALRTHGLALPVVLMVDLWSGELERRLARLPVAATIIKPLGGTELIAKVEAALGAAASPLPC